MQWYFENPGVRLEIKGYSENKWVVLKIKEHF